LWIAKSKIFEKAEIRLLQGPSGEIFIFSQACQEFNEIFHTTGAWLDITIRYMTGTMKIFNAKK
jgi:hypothetical protein